MSPLREAQQSVLEARQALQESLWQTQTLAGGPNPQFETQLRLSASGNNLSAIWMETFNNITSVLFAQGNSN